MRSVLIVDDEKPARELLKMRVEWGKIGFDKLYFATDGEEALKIYIESAPTLVMTDIQMPVMDGIRLISEIKKINHKQHIIILSCHESFTYAKKAIKLGVTDYLIKDSFEPEELYSILGDIFADDFVYEEGSRQSAEQSDDEKSRSLAVKRLVVQGVGRDELAEYIRRRHLRLDSDRFVLLYIDVENKKNDISDPQNLFIGTQEVIEILGAINQILDADRRGEVFYDSSNGFAVICCISKKISGMDILKEATGISNEIRNAVGMATGKNTTIGISRVFHGLEHAGKAFEEGKNAMLKKIFMGYNKTFYYTDNSFTNEKHSIELLNMKIDRIRQYLEDGNFQQISSEISDIFLQNIKGFMQYNYLKHTNWVLLKTVIEFCYKNSLSLSDICENKKSPLDNLMETNTVEEMCSWFLEVFGNLKKAMEHTDEKCYSFYVKKSIVYIKKNYADDISLSSLSKVLQINSAYLARMFKKETGTNITDFINKTRVDEAKDLILNTNKKFYEISQETGFNNTQRFYMLFKSIVGKSPGDFRKN